MDKIKWIIFVAIVVGTFGLIIWSSKSESPSTFVGDPAKIIPDGPITDQVFGSKEQKVVLIEYGDFQCPFCSQVYPDVKELTEKYKDKLTFIFRNFPLTKNHPNALAAATVAEAAGQQGKYWEMNNLLYETQQAWSNIDSDQRGAMFESYATQLGLDLEKFKQDLAGKEVSDKINRDRETAKTFKIDSTPSFVIDGQKFTTSSATDIPALASQVEAALKAAYPGFQPINSTPPENSGN